MSDTACDLSGRWRGIYNYPNGHGSTPFDADLQERAGLLSGVISEHDTWTDGRLLTAAVDGTRNGNAVQFTKFYDGSGEEYDVVTYAGEVTDDGTEISGRWEVAGDWSGSFIMTRPADLMVPAALEAVEPVP